MLGITNFETFLLTGILLNLTPGNDTIFILTRSIGQGRKAGIVSAIGIATGSLIHTILAAFGLSVLIAKSILFFNLLKYAGAVYLVYIGYKMLTDKRLIATDSVLNTNSVNYSTVYRDAIITNVLNPKVALFFIAFLPQFIDSTLSNTALPFLILGATFIATGLTWCLTLSIFAASIFAKLKGNQRVSGYINSVCGLTLIGLGIKVALTNKQ